MNKSLQAKVDIKNLKDINPYKDNPNSLAYHILDSALTSTNGTKLRMTPLTEPLKEISAYENGYKEEVRTVSSTDPISWTMSDSIYGALEGGKVASISDALNKYIYIAAERFINVYKLLEYNEEENTFKLGIPIMEQEKTLSLAEDDDGTSYYYRGAIDDNYVEFADMCWRIVRIEGDESIKLVLASELVCSKENVTTSSGVATDGDKGTVGSDLYLGDNVMGEMKFNIKNPYVSKSGPKEKLNGWLAKKITGDDLTKLKEDNWCVGDLSNIYDEKGNIIKKMSEIDDSTVGQTIYHDGWIRYNLTEKPDLRCQTTGVEGELDKNKVGTLTMDEIAFAGGGKGVGILNKDNYLNDYTGRYWTMTAFKTGMNEYGDTPYDSLFYTYGGNIIISSKENYKTAPRYFNVKDARFRPAVTLLNSTITTSGDGTLENPYKID